MARVKPAKQNTRNGANVGYEAELWQMADTLRGSMGAAEYKHMVRHIVHHLAAVGVADFVLDNRWVSSDQSGESEIRRHLIKADLVD